MRARAVAITIAAVAVLAAACGGSATSAPPSSAPSIAASAPSSHPSGAPISTGSPAAVSKDAIVGEWVGVLQCSQVETLLRGAKLDAFVAPTVVNLGLISGVDTPSQIKDPAHPCAGASDHQYSHFFADDGSFGSKDAHAMQVETGTWKIEDGKVVINDQPFGFSVGGQHLTLTPPSIDASCKSKECRTAAAWALVLAMPGTTWTKGVITP